MKGILPIIQKGSGCCYHRIVLPLKYLGVDTEAVPRITTHDILKETKILLFNRITDNKIVKVLNLKKKYGFKIVLDLDDYWQLNIKHHLYKMWKDKKITEEILTWLKLADAVTVTTTRLADKVKEINPNVHVLPNGLPFDEDQFKRYRIDSEKTRFIYAGGASHFWDIQLLKNPFLKLNGRLPNSEFILAGYSPQADWDKIERSFNLNGSLKNYVRRNGEQLRSYMKVYENADVSLVPLEDNVFNPYKSNLKVLEAGCKNIPVICSNVAPYSDERFDSPIMYAKNTRDWVDFMTACTNKSFREDRGQELGEYVRANYNLHKINEYRKQLFESLMN